ncbi:MAG: methyl-accepting chemotaxis protein [Isosphaeraceae bacterium]
MESSTRTERRGPTIREKLMLLVGLFVTGFLSFGTFVYWGFERVKVNGPVYDQIVMLKDLVADFLPTPENIVESHLITHQLVAQTGKGDVADLVARSRELRARYDERRQFWLDCLAPGRLREVATSDAYEAATAYFSARDEQLIPAVLAGDQAAARKIRDEILEPCYQRQRAAVDTVIALSQAQVRATEAATSRYVHARLWVVCSLGTLILASVVGLSLRIVRAVTRPLAETTRVLETVAAGDLTARFEAHTHDEFGHMGRSLNKALELMSGTVRSIGENAQSLAGASEELATIGQEMSSNAEETSALAGVVSTASGQVNSNVQTVTAAVEEMGATIREIARHSGEAARVAVSAVGLASTTNATVAQLGRSSDEIGSVVKVITSIAEQTNLLALNATIEAARAGETGKGFAVVANEVKELAKQTAKATDEIGRKVQAIQGDTSASVQAIDRVGHIIGDVNALQSTIAGAVEEQTAAANEIIRNVNEAARGMREITSIIQSVALAAGQTNEGAGQMQSASRDLARMASNLNALVAQFSCDPVAETGPPAAAPGATPNVSRRWASTPHTSRAQTFAAKTR